MTIDRRLLSIIGRRFPAIYDVIPRGPQAVFVNRLSEVALNPQPLPPHELGAAIAGEFIHAAWLANHLGLTKVLFLRIWMIGVQPYRKYQSFRPGGHQFLNRNQILTQNG